MNNDNAWRRTSPAIAPWSHVPMPSNSPMVAWSHGPRVPWSHAHDRIPPHPHFKVDGGSPNLFLPAWLRPPGWCWMLGVKLARFLLCGRGLHFPRSFLSNFEVGGEGGCTTASEANLRICQTGFSCLWAQKFGAETMRSQTPEEDSRCSRKVPED